MRASRLWWVIAALCSLRIGLSLRERGLLARSPLTLSSGRVVLPGDFVALEKYGTSVYRGQLRDFSKGVGTESMGNSMASLQFREASILIPMQKASECVFFVHRPDVLLSCDEEMELVDSIVDRRTWNKQRDRTILSCRRNAVKLLQVLRTREEQFRPPCVVAPTLFADFEDSFPYPPTNDQLACFRDIAQDMSSKNIPMDRLICGDVGFGKTEVGFHAICRAVLAGRQVAFLAPTRILARQHFESLSNRFPNLKICLLHSHVPSSLARNHKHDISDGTCQVVVGTQSILGTSIKYKSLGLLVIDEEQRFGVEDKVKLLQQCPGLDVLTLSATPIPRTLKMATEGIMDISHLRSAPQQRKEVTVELIPATPDHGNSSWCVDFARLGAAIRDELARGGQTFVVVPYIHTMASVVEQIREHVPTARIIDIYGRMEDIEERVEQFERGAGDVLVATTVIENGINIPSCNTMAVLAAERFGLSTLYQLKGRVGRAREQAHAFLFLNSTAIEDAPLRRLKALMDNRALGSGESISREDSLIRGTGSLYGTQQSGKLDWVGVELSSHYMATQIGEIKKQLVMAASDTIVVLDDDLERLARKLKGLVYPRAGESSAEFEHGIVSFAVDYFVEKGRLSQEHAARLRALLMRCVSQDQAARAEAAILEWCPVIPLPFQQLLRRLNLRILAHKAGVSCIARGAQGRFQMTFENMDAMKMKNLCFHLPDNLPSFTIEEGSRSSEVVVSCGSSFDDLATLLKGFATAANLLFIAVKQTFAGSDKSAEQSL